MNSNTQDCVFLANKLILVCKLPIPRVTAVTEIRSIFFVSLYNSVSGEQLPDIHKFPQNSNEEVSNMERVISSFSKSLLRVPIPHIRARALVFGELESLYNLLQLFDHYLVYLAQDIPLVDNIGQLVESDDDENYSTSLDGQQQHVISSSFNELSHHNSSELVTYSTHELIDLGTTEYKKLPPHSPLPSNSENVILAETPTHQLIKESEDMARILGLTQSDIIDEDTRDINGRSFTPVSETWGDRSSQDISPMPEIVTYNGRYFTVPDQSANHSSSTNLPTGQFINDDSHFSDISTGKISEHPQFKQSVKEYLESYEQPLQQSTLKEYLQPHEQALQQSFEECMHPRRNQVFPILKENWTERAATIEQQKFKIKEMKSICMDHYRQITESSKLEELHSGLLDSTNQCDPDYDEDLDFLKKRLTLLSVTSPELRRLGLNLEREQEMVGRSHHQPSTSSIHRISSDNPKCKKLLLAKVMKKQNQHDSRFQEMIERRNEKLKVQGMELDQRIRRAQIRRFYHDHQICH